VNGSVDIVDSMDSVDSMDGSIDGSVDSVDGWIVLWMDSIDSIKQGYHYNMLDINQYIINLFIILIVSLHHSITSSHSITSIPTIYAGFAANLPYATQVFVAIFFSLAAVY